MPCATTNKRYFTVTDLALHFAVAEWKVLQLFRRGLLPEPSRAGGMRIIPADDLPRVEEALRGAGYLDVEE